MIEVRLSENLTYVDGSHPFSGEDLYAVQPEGGMEYISVIRYSTNSIRYVELIHPDSEYFQELSGFETIIPYLIMFSVGYYLLRKADGRRPKIVFDTVGKTLTKKHKFHSKPLYLEHVNVNRLIWQLGVTSVRPLLGERMTNLPNTELVCILA